MPSVVAILQTCDGGRGCAHKLCKCALAQPCFGSESIDLPGNFSVKHLFFIAGDEIRVIANISVVEELNSFGLKTAFLSGLTLA